MAGAYTNCRCVRLYIERWLKAPAQLSHGTLQARGKPHGEGRKVEADFALPSLYDWIPIGDADKVAAGEVGLAKTFVSPGAK